MFEEKKDYWIEFYTHIHEDFRECVKLSWEILKFYILLNSTLVSIVITLSGVLVTSDNFLSLPFLPRKGVILLLLLFPVLIFLISDIGKGNFTRESKRFYRYLSILMKIEEGIGIRDEQRINPFLLRDDIYYVSDDFREVKDEYGNEIRSGDDFVNHMVSGKSENYFRDSVKIFDLFEGFSIIIIIALIVWALFIL